MSWHSHGRARVSASAPTAWGICDGCSFLYSLSDLSPQMEYRGDKLMPTGFKKCPTCIDVPYQFNRPLILPPDPVPVSDPRPERYVLAETNYRTTMTGDRRVTQSGDNRVTQETGDAMLDDLYG